MNLLHFGLKVKDIERAMQAYGDLLGIKWDPVVEHSAADMLIDGVHGPSRVKVTHGLTANGVEIELVQLVEGHTTDDLVMGDREGISHMAFLVDDLDRCRSDLVAKGYRIVNEGSAPRADWLFTHDEKLGGALLQFVKLNHLTRYPLACTSLLALGILMSLAAGESITTATAKQHELEKLALRLSEVPAIQRARDEARQIFLAHPYAETRDGKLSLQDAARQHFYGALQLVTNNDPYHPEISVVCLYEHELDGQKFPSALHGGLENPDNIYRLIPISSDSRYELRGVRHNPAPSQVTYELMDSIPGVIGIGEQLALLIERDMTVGADGSFTITIDSDAANGRPNHIQSTPAAKVLFIRDTLSTGPHRPRTN